MYLGKTIGVVVPCLDEQKQVGWVLRTIPAFVDAIIVVDDGSTDATAAAVQAMRDKESRGRISLLRHVHTQGVGRAIVTGYQESLRQGLDITAIMAGDGQMCPDDLPALVEPVAREHTDYAKGNRLATAAAWRIMPKHRFFGNWILSWITRFISGYWNLIDSQCGYTAISRHALANINVDSLYPSYGYPNDLLIRLSAWGMRVTDVPVRPIYNVGERSKMKLFKVIPALTRLMLRFAWRRVFGRHAQRHEITNETALRSDRIPLYY